MEHIESNTLWNYVAGTASKQQETQIRKHLSSCEACMREFEILNKIEMTLHELDEDTAPVGFSDRVIKKIENEVALDKKIKYSVSIFPYLLMGSFVLAFMTLVIVGLGLELDFTQIEAAFNNELSISILTLCGLLWGLFFIDRICRKFFVPIKYA